MHVIVDQVRIYFIGMFIEVNSQFGQMSDVVGQGFFFDNHYFFFKLGEQFIKTSYIRKGNLEQVFLSSLGGQIFFMINKRL